MALNKTRKVKVPPSLLARFQDDKEIQNFRPIYQRRSEKDEKGKYKIVGYEFDGTIYPKKDQAVAAFSAAVHDGYMPENLVVCGDFQCKYCDYKSHCLESRNMQLGYTHEEYCDRLEVLLELRKAMK